MNTQRQGAYWTEGEVSSLLCLIKKNVSVHDIANIHKRTRGAITSMLCKIARTYYYRDKLSVTQIANLTGLSETAVNAVVSEGSKLEKTDYIKKLLPATAKMEFPITKDRLHNFKVEYDTYLKKQVIDKKVEELTSMIMYQASKTGTLALEMTVLEESRKKKRQFVLQLKNTRISPTFQNEHYIDGLIIAMKTRFPDMLITLDPLNTYILFDWN